MLRLFIPTTRGFSVICTITLKESQSNYILIVLFSFKVFQDWKQHFRYTCLSVLPSMLYGLESSVVQDADFPLTVPRTSSFKI